VAGCTSIASKKLPLTAIPTFRCAGSFARFVKLVIAEV
jgi:hypothetical protein